jgi:hypothetical protein
MLPWDCCRYTVEYKGKFATIRTCGGPVGAYHSVTGDKPRDWTYVDDRITIVNGWTVTKLI